MPDARPRLLDRSWARIALASLVGGLAISAGDHLFHVRTRVLVHHWHPQLDGQSLVVIPLFIAATAAMVVGARPLVRSLPRPSLPSVAVATALFFAAYALSGAIGVRHPWLCLAVLALAFVAQVALASTSRRRALIGVGLLIAAGGCLGEAVTSRLGVFDYVHAGLVVPPWLFPLYLDGAAAIVALACLTLQPPAGRPAADRSPELPGAAQVGRQK